jgi:signal transduction histidine kinase
MLPNSLRWRLPLTYAAIALLTALLLNLLLLVNLHIYYRQLEQAYLLRSGMHGGAELASLLAAGADEATLVARATELATRLGVRLRLSSATGRELVDTGLPLRLTTLRPLGPTAAPGATPAGGETPALFYEDMFVEDLYGFDRFRRSNQQAAITLRAPDSGRPLGELLVSGGPAYGQDIVASVGQIGALVSLLAVLLAAAAGWLVSGRMVRPISALTATSTRMAQGDLSVRASVDRADEIGMLAQSFNRMAGQVEGTVRTLRHFVADAAHELHTPLTALATDLELAASEADPGQARALVARARAQTERLAALTNDLLDLSRLEAGGPPASEPVELGALLRELAESYASRAEQTGVAFELEIPPSPVIVRGQAGQLRRAAGNLLENALKFTRAGGEVRLTLAVRAEHVTVSVCDTGIGIPTEDQARLFERFHRGRNAAGYGGSGLGLAIVRAIMAQHGGEVSVASAPGATTVELRWPMR